MGYISVKKIIFLEKKACLLNKKHDFHCLREELRGVTKEYYNLNKNKVEVIHISDEKYLSKILELSEEDYSSKIGDYYTSLTTDKRFLLLDTAEWDLKDKHKVEIDLDLDDEEELDEEDIEDEEIEEEEEIEDENIEITDDEVDLDDDMEDLTIVDDEDLEEEM